jgi:superfamily II DNA/RNA helicase
MVKSPSDLGFSDERYKLPDLHVQKHTVKNENQWSVEGQGQLFVVPAKRLTEVREEQKLTVNNRSEIAVELARGKTSVYWCNLNDESDLIAELDADAVEIHGGMSLEAKEDALVSFAKGEIKRLITKAKMTSMGLNWQHCNHTVFFPTYSYEQYYQAIRRFWRFGQKKSVTCEMVISEGQERVMEAIEQKTAKAIELYSNLVSSVNNYKEIKKEFNQTAKKPLFL